MEKQLHNIYTKFDKPELQAMVENLRMKLFNIELKEAQGAKFAVDYNLNLKEKNVQNSSFNRQAKTCKTRYAFYKKN